MGPILARTISEVQWFLKNRPSGLLRVAMVLPDLEFELLKHELKDYVKSTSDPVAHADLNRESVLILGCPIVRKFSEDVLFDLPEGS